ILRLAVHTTSGLPRPLTVPALAWLTGAHVHQMHYGRVTRRLVKRTSASRLSRTRSRPTPARPLWTPMSSAATTASPLTRPVIVLPTQESSRWLTAVPGRTAFVVRELITYVRLRSVLNRYSSTPRTSGTTARP